jgi:hypothetical protein
LPDRNGKQVWHSLGPVKDWQGRKKELTSTVEEVRKAIREGRDRTGPETFERVTNKFFSTYVGEKKLLHGKRHAATDRQACVTDTGSKRVCEHPAR